MSKTKLGTAKASLTKIEGYLADENSDFTLITVQAKLRILEPLFIKYDAAYAEIHDSVEEENQDFKEYLDFEERFHFAQAKLLEKFNSLTNNLMEIQSQSESDPRESNARKDVGIKIPKIDIGKFSGKIDDWIRFYESFKTIIHENKSLGQNITKFHFLVSILEGEAAQVINGIDITEDNYDFAWEKLVNYYKNNKILVETHIANLFNAKKLEVQSAKGLRELHNIFVKNINALKKLGEDNVDNNAFIVYLLSSKLDNDTLRKWEDETAAEKEMPKYKDLETFLLQHVNSLDAYERKLGEVKETHGKGKRVSSVFMTQKSDRPNNCPSCDSTWHPLYKCKNFLQKSVEDRRILVQKAHYCYQCLGWNHSVKSCKGRLCSKCHTGKHNYLICQSEAPRKESTTEGTTKTTSTNCALVGIKTTHTSVIFPTCVVKLSNNHGRHVIGRFLLDSGSELNLITKKLADKLNVQQEKDKLIITGIGETKTTSQGYISTQIMSRTSHYSSHIKFYVLPEITQANLLHSTMATDLKEIYTNINSSELADPEFMDPKRKIDGILGVGIFFDVLRRVEYHPIGSESENMDNLHGTAFGWVVCGQIGNIGKKSEEKCFCTSVESEVLKSENISRHGQTKRNKRILEDLAAENEFKNSVKIGADGRYVVTLPFKDNPTTLGNSYDGAKKRLLNLERRFKKEPKLNEAYSEFIKEYINMGHMEEIPHTEVHKWPNYYLPHHAIFKESSTTSLRVVFDASYKTATGISLNDLMMSGPALQNDVFDILTAFRFPKYGITGDIAKMYRQIWIDKNFQDFQRILWRESPEALLHHYRLKTITYGTKAAPFLAIRCLHDIAETIRQTEPELAETIKTKFFMDDYLDGEDTLDELRYKQSRMEQIFKERGMILRKWCTNSTELMKELHHDMENHYSINLSENDTIKTLGLTWNPKTDNLIVQVHHQPAVSSVTKRIILADLHSFWDPIGLLSPALIRGRMFLQELWRVSLGWDEALPEHLEQKWTTFRSDLHVIHGYNIPRRVLINNITGLEFHGFSDASEKAYGACIYVRTWDEVNQYYSQLLCSESHIAPLKEITLPRLELLGALTLARLMERVTTNTKYGRCIQHYWTDSKIVLAWISGCPQQWNRYVADRVVEIQDISNTKNWRYVASEDNPADVVSRGVKAVKLIDGDMWWSGPPWLKNKDLKLSDWTNTGEDVPDKRKVKFSLLCVKEYDLNIIERCSSWSRLIRIIAWILRFSNNCLKVSSERAKGHLSLNELADAKIAIIKLVQAAAFQEDIECLKNGKPRKSGQLLSLGPFLDEKGIIRVGGRILNAKIPETRKFPFILPYKSRITEIIMREMHERHYHVGPQALLSLVRGEFWPLNGKSAAKAITKNCITCRKAAPIPITPRMASLPTDRVNPARPFEVTGVDFCGPIFIKAGAKRSIKRKAYIAVFVCFTTKAIHLELVTDLSAQAFIASLKRFFSRRGMSRTIYSDNGTNFVGAQKELRFFIRDESIKTDCTKLGIEWKFIPPGTPHFGGLWESAVKLTKFHLKRTMAQLIMTFEEAYTVLTGIEACLNSRPITPLSDDPNDPNPLTPSHFLIGGSMILIPEPDLTKLKLTRRWELLKQFIQQFWQRWSTEYLSSLQQRHKWRFSKGQLNIGALVAIKEENLKPAEWKLARVVALHPGQDGIARVATVVGKDRREMKRPMTKLCPIIAETS